MKNMFKKFSKSTFFILLASMLITTSALADSSTVTIYTGEGIKSTRAIYANPESTLHIDVQGMSLNNAVISYRVEHRSSKEVVTSGTVYGSQRKAYGKKLEYWDPHGEYILYLSCSSKNCYGTGKLSN
ncbi:hypothetical protein [Bacillus infantis]|uniref:hypothetical protein n=1 Tax=Bacillus infantis TaxID=324767 RepID=UPI003CF901B3